MKKTNIITVKCECDIPLDKETWDKHSKAVENLIMKTLRENMKNGLKYIVRSENTYATG